MAIASTTNSSTAAASAGSTPGATERLVSLDAFRGATMALMVLVNNPGDGRHTYWPLEHADWNGWTPTDVVFPSFMWIVGVAMTLSFAKRLAAGASRGLLFTQAFRRAVIIYVFGLLVYVYPGLSFSTQRLMGVLQRIAICYLIAAAIYLTTSLRGQIIWIISLLAAYWLMMTLIPVPGYGAGHLDVDGNLAHYIDRIVLGAHNYRHTKTWDPEGIISTIPAIATVLFGIMAGHLLRLQRSLAERTKWLLLIGALLIASGLICNIWLPINKKLWTDSFALFMAGLDSVIFGIFLWLVDGLGFKRAVKPLVIMGMNAITVYLASEFLDEALTATHAHKWLFDTFFSWPASPFNASLLYAIAYVLVMYLLAWFMYRRKWFLRV
jgi:predicted acyltransferase